MARENPPRAVDGDGLRRIADFCRVGLERTGMDGVVVMFQTSATGLEVLYATDDFAERAAQIELVLGEGPNLDALRTTQPTEAQDLDHPVVRHRWPLYGAEAGQLGVRAVHVFPLVFSEGAFGSVALYARQPLRLSHEQQRQGRDLSELIGLALVDPEAGVGMTLGLRMTVHQAAGMVMQQSGASIEDALVLLRLTAFTEDVMITDLAADVIAGRRQFGKAEMTDE